MLRAFVFAALLLPVLASAQPELRSGAKGAKPPRPVTSTSVDADTNALDVSLAGTVTVTTPGTIAAGHSSTTPLGSGATFTGSPALDILNASAITVNVFADQDSAVGGLSLQWSSNGTAWDISESYTVDANDARSIQASPRARYFRVVYTNGGTGQGAFRLQTIVREATVQDRKFAINSDLRIDEAAALSRAVITGETTAGGGAFVNVKVSPSGAVQIGGDLDSIGSITNPVTVIQPVGTNLHIVCDSGCGGGSTDTDDGSVAGGQSGALSIGLTYVWDGAGWVRALGDATNGVLVNLGGNNDVTVTGTVTATGPLTNTELRATPVPVSGTVTATGPLTDTELRATPVPVSGTVTANAGTGTFLVGDGSGPLTVDGTVTAVQSTATNLRIAGGDAAGSPTAGTVLAVQGIASGTAVPVSGTVTATGPLTDTQLRATPVPVSGTVTANAGTNLNTSALALDATLGRAQGSTTSGQTGPLVQGAATTAAPTYTTGQTNPLSLTTAGALRVDGSAVTQPISAPTGGCTTKVAFSQTAGAVLVAGVGGQRIYICGVVIISGADQSVSLIEGTGTVCGTGTVGVMGGTTASMSVVAQGGVSAVAPFPWLFTSVTGNALCLVQSGAGNLSGVITYRQG